MIVLAGGFRVLEALLNACWVDWEAVLYGALYILIGPIVVRVPYEFLMVIFKINERLQDKE